MDANERRSRATDEATQWWTRLGTKAPADVSETDRQEFTQWLRESPLHVAELLQVAHVHDTLESFRLWDEVSISAEETNANVIPLAQFRRSAATRRPRRLRWAVAASVGLIAIVAGWLALRSSAMTIATERAERREVALTDGSVVNLEPETILHVSLGKQQRYVALERGRALFHVAKDSARPFIVHAGDTDVRAVGTIFGVEQNNHSIIVTVSEGKVGVADPAQQGAKVFLTANRQITVRRAGGATPVQRVDSSRALAWSEGRLVFDSTPLSDVVEDFNRYNRVQLRIESPELAARTISGVFRASDPETLIDFIGAGAHVVVKRQGNGTRRSRACEAENTAPQSFSTRSADPDKLHPNSGET